MSNLVSSGPVVGQRPALYLVCGLVMLLGGCAAPSGGPGTPGAAGSPGAAGASTEQTLAQARSALPPESPECLSPKIGKPDPLPVSAIPDAVLRQLRSGWSVIRYDLVGGRVTNPVVAASNPAGLYDPYALAHAARYQDRSGANAKGCYMTVEIKF